MPSWSHAPPIAYADVLGDDRVMRLWPHVGDAEYILWLDLKIRHGDVWPKSSIGPYRLVIME
jgi:hypothetical protein